MPNEMNGATLARYGLSERLARLRGVGYYKREPERFYVYALIDPRDGLYRYVGLTTNPEQRKRQHGKRWQPPTTSGDWILGLRKLGFKPLFAVLDEVAWGVDPYSVEHDWTLRLLRQNHPLVNNHHCRAGQCVVYSKTGKGKSGAETR